MVDNAHSDGHIFGLYGENEGLWEYTFDEIKGVDFYFSDNPVEAMNVRDVLYWLWLLFYPNLNQIF